MRRPNPLPQPPRKEAEIVAPAESESSGIDESFLKKKRKHSEQAPQAKSTEAVDPNAETDLDIEALSESFNGSDGSESHASTDHETTVVITPLTAGRKSKKERSSDEDASSTPDEGSADESAEESDAESDEDDTLRNVGVRDVWRAARAKRKALRSEVRRFTVRSRRRRLIWIVALSALALTIGGSFAVAYSPLFAVTKITVQGTNAIDPAAVQASLQSQMNKPLALVNDSDIKAALVTYPFVETYTVQARPPHELVITIVERTPVGVVSTPAGFSLVDAAGVVLSTTPEQPPGQPLFEVAGELGDETFASAGLVMLSVPEALRASVEKVTATTPSDVTLTLAPTGTQVIWGNSDESQLKAETLTKAMIGRPIDTVSVYDVSSPTAIVIR